MYSNFSVSRARRDTLGDMAAAATGRMGAMWHWERKLSWRGWTSTSQWRSSSISESASQWGAIPRVEVNMAVTKAIRRGRMSSSTISNWEFSYIWRREIARLCLTDRHRFLGFISDRWLHNSFWEPSPLRSTPIYARLPGSEDYREQQCFSK